MMVKPDQPILIKTMAESERPREKLVQNGASSLSNAELLAILIRTGTKDVSAIELAQRILAMDQEGIKYLADCTVQELSKIKGIGTTKACQIVSAIEIGRRIAKSAPLQSSQITSPRDVANMFMEEMRYYKKEYFKILLMNTKNVIIATEVISIGNLNASLVHPREVFVRAIKKSAAAIILLHNHPSGNPQPSQEDISITKRLIEAGAIIGIEVLDHIIIGDGCYKSLKELSII
ncbi:DNA replication and repair protein RadC [Geosporobacter subterraneus DSM 17957]|uniref:DNA replication and repair protein RadC n=1 Tax=Geosporobacter subterraneus DSM 17957 TaxID=1121919 RepID=A0A1M6N2M1_9FIRM|nr:DNA repair protein RadC [Geosporobacter subterraneus]SHJ89935.1 DNA replication and repair protein RadC [Geosporobacter subterraneus DSM 17957]